jgi:FAD/FMN-containing dehydrogenase
MNLYQYRNADYPGIAGITMGGGTGPLTGQHGTVCDNLVSAKIVLADGRVLPASEKENPDLFWAIRGCGPNFGVVTEFTYTLHKQGLVFQYVPLPKSKQELNQYSGIFGYIAQTSLTLFSR